jgi:cysteine-rich repeat protein
MPTLIPCGGPVAGNCGNGVTDAGETCDDGNTVSCDGCSSTCQLERCGDGRVGCDEQGRHEACDDGNTVGCDGCAADCTRRDRICGDGIEECGEQCDTGSAIDCDAGACSASCQVEGCGNGRVECAEQCDDGGPSAACSDTCLLLTPAMCGDGHLDPGEGCDDGNTTDCDGCSRLCQPEGCGNGVTECDEECDDFNTTACDGCSGTCHLETCGNGIVDCGEECDLGDDNGKPGTNCLACRFAPICSAGTSGACIPCNDVFDCDPLGRCAGTDCLDGVCMPDPVDCTSDDPCEIGSCDPLDGCVATPVVGFDSVRCRLGDVAGVLGGDGLSDKARSKLGKLLDKADRKVDAAEAALDAGKAKRVGKSLRKARGAMVRFGKKVVRLQPKQIGDPDVGAALSEGSGDALARINALRNDLGF